MCTHSFKTSYGLTKKKDNLEWFITIILVDYAQEYFMGNLHVLNGKAP